MDLTKKNLKNPTRKRDLTQKKLQKPHQEERETIHTQRNGFHKKNGENLTRKRDLTKKSWKRLKFYGQQKEGSYIKNKSCFENRRPNGTT